MSYSEVYPRAYGETSVRRALRRASAGLSPRIRGNRKIFHFDLFLSGSIPAHTGKPRVDGNPLLILKVYPRAYGETILGSNRLMQYGGLSPRIRGNRGEI